MNKLVKRAGVVTLLAMVLSAPAVLVAMENCVQFISSSGDEPLTGYLLGESTVTKTTTKSLSGWWNWLNFGGTFNSSSTITESYTVGNYYMSNGSIQQVRCDSYQRV